LLYHLTYKAYRGELDEVSAMIVRAASETDARGLAAAAACDEGHEIWLDPMSSDCEPILPDGPPMVLMKDVAGF
jgi:hypothetical protein